MAHAADVWNTLTGMLASGDLDDLPNLYDIDALYLEPYNPPHNGSLLIHAYLKDHLSGKDDITLDAKRATTASRWPSSGRSPAPPVAGAGPTCRGPPSSSSTTPASSPTKRDYS